MASLSGEGYLRDRVRDSSGVNIEHLECSICKDLLWIPVACQTCETPFCSACIKQWRTNRPIKCPSLCDTFIERKCPPFIVKMLSQLQIACAYQIYGCMEIIPYEALEKHELQCDYRRQQCSGCHLEVSKRELANHEANCALIDVTCPDCKFVYKRCDASMVHTDNVCLREQLRQLRIEFQENKRELQDFSQQMKELRTLQALSHKYVTITFHNLMNSYSKRGACPELYRGLKWSGFEYMYESYARMKHANSGYVYAFQSTDSSCIIFSSSHASISVDPPNEVFSVLALTACAAWIDNLQLTITGHRNSIKIKNHISALRFGKPQEIILGWTDIDMLTFESSREIRPSETPNSGNQFIFTCLRFAY
ncbi:unnamed protein product [Adineta steineri]|uniref:Uncharacterized protein n=1 Tax=Adineta steineri TaxID=433720 RepID=A0A814YUC4_9BILA|nr:unnamed protein product [Adineta steineri]